jgi:hypothetical protein
MMQFVVATKAGLVNHVQGMTNVKATEIVKPGAPIRTAPDGYVEVLLTPGSYLRMAGNSEAVLNSVELSDVSVSILQGVANVEVVELNSEQGISVTTGNLTVQITDAGIYRFSDGVATVIEGKLQTIDPKIVYKKGWQLSFTDNYRAQRISNSDLSALDVFSKKRSELIASANMTLAPAVNHAGFRHATPYWVYSPSIGMYTYIPFGNRRSPYGFRYNGVEPYFPGGGYNGMRTANSDTSSSRSSSGSASSSSPGGGSFGGGSPVFATPSGGSSSPGDYSGSKNPPARPAP